MSFGRFLRATGIVALIGALGGMLGGVLVGGLLTLLVPGELGGDGTPFTLVEQLRQFAVVSSFASLVGAVYGMVLGPFLTWTLMRRVPVGRAIGETAFAAALGVGLSWAVPGMVGGTFLWPVVAATLAAGRLHVAYLRAPERTKEIGPP